MNDIYTDWGLTHYDSAFEDQKRMVDKRIEDNIPDTLVFTEHHPVYTLGKRTGSDSHILWDDTQLQAQGIAISKTNRGGDITYHGPGQIVGYPIVSLQNAKDLHLYLRNLEQVIINALGCHGLAASRRKDYTGIWLKERKIAAIGVAVKRWVTYHGFALNVTSNLKHFEGIVPCGITKDTGSVTSMQQELGVSASDLDLKEIKNTLAIEFWKLFKTNH